VETLLIALIFGMASAALCLKIFEMRHVYREQKGQGSLSFSLAFFTAIPAFLFVMAPPFSMLPQRIYLWVLFLGLLWITLLHERLRHRMAGHDPEAFVPLMTEKLAEIGGWVFAGGVLALLMLFFMQRFTPAEIGTARMILVRLKAVLKLLKLGGGATILPLAAVLIAQWRFPKRKEMLDRLWKH
jgi:hypothetical protein